MNNLKYAIEGILFAAGEPVKASKLAVVLETDIEKIYEAVDELKVEYNSQHRGFNIIDIMDGYQICSRPEYYQYIQEILGEQRNQPLSNAAMEALAIIAYKQPITRGQIEHIRGVNSDGCVNRLYERGLIDEAGRLDAPGRPILYVTTPTFLRCFGLKSPKDLPPINFKQLHIDDIDDESNEQSEEQVTENNISEADAAQQINETEDIQDESKVNEDNSEIE
jgi:segregation and condensation protein B